MFASAGGRDQAATPKQQQIAVGDLRPSVGKRDKS
jgi:hypothetical protein